MVSIDWKDKGEPVNGDVASGFERLADVFAQCVDEAPNAGSAFCLYVEGRPVVDLVGGRIEPGGPYFEADTLQLVLSATKGISATAVWTLVERGLLDVDAPIIECWPEFAQHGKSATTMRMVLGHRAGLPCYDRELTRSEVLDGKSAAAALAEQAPLWGPGSAHGYHAVTYGFLIGEVVRRITGQSLGELVHASLSEPLGLDLWVGLPHSEEERVAPLQPGSVAPTEAITMELARFVPGSLPGRALTLNGVLDLAGRKFAYNDPAVRAGELPASNAVCTARSLARLYSSTVTDTLGVRTLNIETVKSATTTVSRGDDLVLGRHTHFGGGFMLPIDEQPLLGPSSFGHPGAGGSLGMADPDLGVGLAFTTTGLGAHVVADPRAVALVDATRACLRR